MAESVNYGHSSLARLATLLQHRSTAPILASVHAVAPRSSNAGFSEPAGTNREKAGETWSTVTLPEHKHGRQFLTGDAMNECGRAPLGGGHVERLQGDGRA